MLSDSERKSGSSRHPFRCNGFVDISLSIFQTGSISSYWSKEEEDIIAECQDVARLNIPRITEIGDMVAGAPRRCVQLFIKVGELIKTILS